MPFRSVALALLILVGLAVRPGRVHAQANVTFTGAMGAPLKLTLNAPVTYLITTASTGSRLNFDLQSAGNFFTGGTQVTGNVTFSINNGAPVTINYLGNSTGLGDIAGTDLTLFTFPSMSTVNIGDTVQLLAGTLTTTSNASGVAPVSRAYQTFVANENGTRLDALNGVSVPEPATWALLGLGATGLGLTVRTRRARRV